MVALAILLTLFLMLVACWVPRDPNQCNFWGAVIGGALGLVGSLANNKSSKAAHASDTYNNSPQGIRANAEQAGINPLTVMSSGRSFGAGYSPTFENAGVHLGNAVQAGFSAFDRQKLQMTQLKKQNNRLQRQMESTTFDVKAPSVYERRASNAGPETSVQAVASDHSLGVSSWVAPGRDVEKQPYTTGSGLTEINNRGTFGPLVVPGSDGEPWGIDELATAVVVGVPQYAYKFGKFLGKQWDAPNQRRADASMDEWFRRSRDKDPIYKRSGASGVPYSPALNPPLRDYYGRPGSRTGF